MAKYTIDSSTLTSIADAIRSQYQDGSPINPLDMAEAILGIEGGGGGDYDFLEVGEFTPSSKVLEYSVEVEKGIIPTFVLCYAEDLNANIPYMHKASFGRLTSADAIDGVSIFNNNNGVLGTLIVTYKGISEITESRVTFATRGGNYCFPSGQTYKYILIY